MAYEGAIRFNSKIDNSQAEKDLKQLERKIKQAQDNIAKSENAKLPLEKQLENVNKELSTAKENLKYARSELKAAQNIANSPDVSKEDYDAATAAIPSLRKGVEQASKEVNKLRKKWQSTKSKINECDLAIQRSRDSITENTAAAQALNAKMNSSGYKISQAFARVKESAEKFRKQILRVGTSMIMFRVFSAVMQGISNYMSKILKTNEEYTTQLAQLKAALMTAFQPIYEFILPGLMAVLKVLTSIVMVVANVISALGGKSLAQNAKNAKALNEEADAIEAVGGAAKDAGKSLANFDEINTLNTGESGGGSGSSGGIDIAEIKPNFDALEDMADSLGKILKTVIAIGAGILSWRIAKAFTQSLKAAAGIATAVGGAFLYAFSWADAFANGISWKNLSKMLASMTLIIGGLALAFGTTGAAIGALVTGVGLIVLALYEFIKTGKLTNKALAALEIGILAVGAGIGLLTGSWIPVLIAAIVGLVVLMGTRGEEIKGILQKLDNWLKNVFEKDWTEVFGITMGTALNILLGEVGGVWRGLKQILEGIIDFVSGVFTGNWKKAWSGLGMVIKGTVNGIIGFINGMVSGVVSGMNAVIRALSKIKFTIPAWVPAFGGKYFGFNIEPISAPQIPYLAQGAVLPPNKPFMAMVGDQKNGTNIEAPLATIQEALANVLAAQGTGDINITFTGDLAQLGRVLKPVIDRENNRVGGSLAKGAL